MYSLMASQPCATVTSALTSTAAHVVSFFFPKGQVGVPPLPGMMVTVTAPAAGRKYVLHCDAHASDKEHKQWASVMWNVACKPTSAFSNPAINSQSSSILWSIGPPDTRVTIRWHDT